MTKVVHCRDLGFDCEGIVRAETEAQAMQQVADYARDVHGLQSVSEEVVEKVRQVMREE
jgi:predicted small metal-binding protein